MINEIWWILNNTKSCKGSEASLDNLFFDSTSFKLNFIGTQHPEYLDIREIKTPKKPLKNPWPFRRVKGLLRVIKSLPWPLRQFPGDSGYFVELEGLESWVCIICWYPSACFKFTSNFQDWTWLCSMQSARGPSHDTDPGYKMFTDNGRIGMYHPNSCSADV